MMRSGLGKMRRSPRHLVLAEQKQIIYDHRGKRAPVVITELRALTWRLAVDEITRPSRIQSLHPVADR